MNRMSIEDNIQLSRKIEKILAGTLPIKLGPNKKNELVRLVYEICKREGASPETVLISAGVEELSKDGKGGLFSRLKSKLLEARYPSMRRGDKVSFLPLSFGEKLGVIEEDRGTIVPKRIFVEKEVKDAAWTAALLRKFPEAEVIHVGRLKDGLAVVKRSGSPAVYDSRRENIFIVKARSAFVKACPCTKRYKRCGYWILNLGFGCPFNCTYCYLQTYSNIPGIILPANIEDYLPHLEALDRKAEKGARIGTGEFADSLALDEYTNYSSGLIPVFAGMKNLVLELKTKTARIDSILGMRPNANVVISWSMNTPFVAERYEKGASSVDERIRAAGEAAARGFRVGFHFDPLVHYAGWEKDYRAVAERMFADERVRRNTAWISLGTLRYTPGLKEAAEKRFADNMIFYQGEFFADSDGKLRYHRELREAMYREMARWIRSRGVEAWIYPCMEPEEIWKNEGLDPENAPCFSDEYERDYRQ